MKKNWYSVLVVVCAIGLVGCDGLRSKSEHESKKYDSLFWHIPWNGTAGILRSLLGIESPASLHPGTEESGGRV